MPPGRVPPPKAKPLRPPALTMVRRAASLRCPLCAGRRAWLRGWFAKHEACQTCGFAWRRGADGFETGSMTLNFIITFGVLTVGLIVAVVATYPDLPVGPLLGGFGAVAVTLPLVLFPFTNLLWSAVELLMHPLEPNELEVLPTNVRTKIQQ